MTRALKRWSGLGAVVCLLLAPWVAWSQPLPDGRTPEALAPAPPPNPPVPPRICTAGAMLSMLKKLKPYLDPAPASVPTSGMGVYRPMAKELRAAADEMDERDALLADYATLLDHCEKKE
jgi:hypothetical protein